MTRLGSSYLSRTYSHTKHSARRMIESVSVDMTRAEDQMDVEPHVSARRRSIPPDTKRVAPMKSRVRRRDIHGVVVVVIASFLFSFSPEALARLRVDGCGPLTRLRRKIKTNRKPAAQQGRL